MVKKKTSESGFKWALFYTALTLIFFFYGLRVYRVYSLLLAILFGVVGLYWVKKSWVSYKPSKKTKVRKGKK